jgi:hypothetical protein
VWERRRRVRICGLGEGGDLSKQWKSGGTLPRVVGVGVVRRDEGGRKGRGGVQRTSEGWMRMQRPMARPLLRRLWCVS